MLDLSNSNIFGYGIQFGLKLYAFASFNLSHVDDVKCMQFYLSVGEIV